MNSHLVATVFGLAALLGARVAAAENYTITPPEGWSELPALVKTQKLALQKGDPLAGDNSGVIVIGAQGAGTLTIAWVENGRDADVEITALLRRALDRTRHSRLETGESGKSTVELSYREQVQGGVVDARLTWDHLSNETTSRVRTLLWLTSSDAVQFARAECVSRRGDAAAGELCSRALATFAAKPGPRHPVPSLPPSDAAPEAAAAAAPEQLTLNATENADGPPASLSPATEKPGVLYKSDAPPEPQSSSGRWFLVVGAALVLIAVYTWVRRRDQETGDEPEDEATAVGSDDDGEDLDENSSPPTADAATDTTESEDT